MKSRERFNQHFEDGFSLAEVLVGMGISMVALLGTAEMLSFQHRAATSVTKVADYNTMVNAITLALSSSDACSRTNFLGMTFNGGGLPMNLSSITSGGSPILQIGQVIGQIRPTHLYISQVLSTFAISATDQVYIVNMHLEVDKQVNATQLVVGSRISSTDFKVMLGVDPTAGNTVTRCGLLNAAPTLAETCVSLSGTYNPATFSCDFYQKTCTSLGGTWVAATSSCTGILKFYEVQVPGGSGAGSFNALCNSGDLATGGGGAVSSGNNIQSWPHMTGSIADGWHCQGSNVSACHVLCVKNTWP